jgi:hypothetical protein
MVQGNTFLEFAVRGVDAIDRSPVVSLIPDTGANQQLLGCTPPEVREEHFIASLCIIAKFTE